MFRQIDRCRLCGHTQLQPLIDLGLHALTGVFPRERNAALTRGPLELVRCHGPVSESCGLVQLRHSYDLAELYGRNYGYRSSLNRSMVEHLQRRVAKALELVPLAKGDVVLDIGSNDGTLLKAYPDRGLTLVGMDPTIAKFRAHYPPHITAIEEFFSAERFRAAVGDRRPRIVTSIAMFYDLESPLEFVRDIEKILADDGIWVFEQSYTPTMVAMTAYDTICHEHLEYYCLEQIKWTTDRAGLKIVDIELNDVNGGSFAVTVAKKRSAIPEATDRIASLLAEEKRAGFGTLEPFQAFKRRVFHHRDRLREVVATTKEAGRTVFGYGASTKGNVILQFCGLTEWDLTCMAEVNADKFGCFTPGTDIPIVSEEEARAKDPDFFLVMPWHFRKNIVEREAAFLKAGKHLIFPLPELEIVGADGVAGPEVIVDAARIPDPLYREIQRSMPIPCVDLLVTDPRGRILLLRRVNPPARGEWWSPGGRVHHGELRIDAARRKLREECGLAPVEVEELGTFDVLFEGDQSPGASHGISTVFRVVVEAADVRLDAQSADFAWRSAAEWLGEVRHPFLAAMLRRAIEWTARGKP